MGSSQAILTDLFVVSVVWGFHIVSIGCCMHALFTSRRARTARKVNWGMVAVSWILFVNATFNRSLAVRHVFQAFTSTKNGEEAAVAFAISDWSSFARTTSVVFQTLIGDAVLIYRCWIVYHRSWSLVAPSVILWLGLVGSTIWTLVLEGSLNVLFNARQIRHAIMTFWIITIILNVMTTGLLAYRIWSVDHANRKNRLEVIEFTGEDRLRSIMNIIIESGLLYTISAIAAFSTYISGSSYVYLASGVEIEVVGIAFNLIIIRTTYLSRRLSTMRWQVAPGSQIGTTQSVPLQFASTHSTRSQTPSKTEIFVSSSVVTEVEGPP